MFFIISFSVNVILKRAVLHSTVNALKFIIHWKCWRKNFILLGAKSSLHRTKRELSPYFIPKHVTSITDIDKITYDFLRGRLPPEANTRERKKHTYIVVLRTTDDDVRSFLQELESLISQKITDGKCHNPVHQTKNNPHTCRQNNRNYLICSVKMDELNTTSYLAEFDLQDRRVCKISEHGIFELGAMIDPKYKGNFYVNHLQWSSLHGNKRSCVNKG